MRKLAAIYNKHLFYNLQKIRGTDFLRRWLESFSRFEPIENFQFNDFRLVGYGHTDQVQNVILNKRMEEYELLERMEKSVRSDDIFFDIGANFGLITNYLSFHTEADIRSYEPYPPNIWLLELNRYLFDRDYSVEQSALGDSSGEVEFYVSSVSTGKGGLAQKDGHDYEKKIIVEQKKIDRLEEKPDVIKIDVEGAEMDVLKGAESTIGSVREIFLELHPNYILEEFDTSQEEIIRYLEGKGFDIELLFKDESERTEPSVSGSENLQLLAKNKDYD